MKGLLSSNSGRGAYTHSYELSQNKGQPCAGFRLPYLQRAMVLRLMTEGNFAKRAMAVE